MPNLDELDRQWSANLTELFRLELLPIPENETERDKIADQIIELDRKQSEIAVWGLQFSGTSDLRSEEWGNVVERRRKKQMKDWFDQLSPERRAELEREGYLRWLEMPDV